MWLICTFSRRPFCCEVDSLYDWIFATGEEYIARSCFLLAEVDDRLSKATDQRLLAKVLQRLARLYVGGYIALEGFIMGLASVWNQPSELEALWSSSAANVSVWIVLGGIIGLLVRFWPHKQEC